MNRRATTLLAGFAVLGSCSRPKGADRIDAGPPIAAAPLPTAAATASASTRAPDATPSKDHGAAEVWIGDAGVAACKMIGAPALQRFVGPALLRSAPSSDADAVEVVYNDAGFPRIFDGRPVDAATRGTPAKSTIPSCAAAGDVFYCPDATGAIHRSRGTPETDAVVAKSKPGTDLAAASLAGRPLVAYLADRVTTEGLVREAWAAMEGAAPLRVSEDGSGATFVDLAPRGDTLLALTIDARVAMTPAHARVLSLDGDKIAVGKDAVIFVGGAGERHNAGTLAIGPGGTAFALIPVSEDAVRFGMAAIAIDDPPVDDSRVVWNFYPNGIDPAPVAATRGESALHVARVRPKNDAPDAPHLLEVGMLDATGAFRPSCVAAESTFVKDVEVVQGRQKSLWVFYRTPAGSHLAHVTTP
jgi:hypothetical protein